MFTRGNLQIGLRIELDSAEDISINSDLLDALCQEFQRRDGTAPKGAALATLLTTKGVIDSGSGASVALRTLGENKNIHSVLMESFDEALRQLAETRAEEGVALSSFLGTALDGMEAERQKSERLASEQPGVLKERLETKLTELQADRAVDVDRLAAEVALTAAKADVREELDRLSAHIETGRTLLASGEPVGRKLDFLAQELNREANTLCSKSTSLALTNAGLALKTWIDQFKEQAANVE